MTTISPYKLHLFKAQSGFISAKLIHQDGHILHLHSLVRPEEESNYFNSISIWGEKVVLLGTGLGYHLGNLRSMCSKEVLIVDYYQECVDFCKSEMLKDLKTVVSVSSQTQDISGTIRRFIGDGFGVQVIKHPVSYRANRAFFEEIQNLSFCEKRKNVSAAKVLILSGNFFLQEELKNACLHDGLQTVLFNPKEFEGILDYESSLQKILQKEIPDFVISVNMLGFDGCGILSDLTNRHSIPVAVWFVDDPRPILLHQQQFIKKNTYAFCWEKAYLPFLKTCGFADTHYLPLATDPEMFKPEGPVFHPTHLGFVGSSMGKIFLEKITSKFLWKRELDPLVRTVARKIISDSHCDIKKEIQQSCEDLSFSYPYTDCRNETWFQSYIIHTASMLKRKMLIESLTPLGIELFGDPEGWHLLCGDNIVCHPDIDYRNTLASVYRGITLNINTTSCQMVSAVNQRVFDIPACGGFLLTDMQSDLLELFEKDEVVRYDSLDELIEKITFFSEHPGERSLISSKARAHIIEEHTYTHRLQKMVNCIF
jgi:spore maturation protein CgeB